jgi:endonuclease YncB( thermonuclease family)
MKLSDVYGDLHVDHPPVIDLPDLYWYKATVIKEWHDADTVWVKIDFGMDESRNKVKLRLARIDAFAAASEKGKKGSQLVNTLLPVGRECFIKTVPTSSLNADDKIEKWGRFLVEVFIQVDDLPGLINLNDALVQQGYALPWMGEGDHPTGEIVR